MIIVLPLAAGMIVGWVRGGKLTGLGGLRFRSNGLIAAALAIQLFVHRVPVGWRVALVLVSYAAAGLWISRNLAGRSWWVRGGLALIALGWAMNLVAIVPNGGMPVSAAALRALGVTPGYNVADGHLSKHVATHDGPVDLLFGDSIPVAPLHAVISVGDVLLAAGVALTVAGAMTTVRRRRWQAGVVTRAVAASTY